MECKLKLARVGLRGAIELRKKIGLNNNQPICIYDLCEKLNVAVFFQGGSSFGGMYSRSTNTIIVPSERPQGRQIFTCAHELGHWYFGHGSKIDVYDQYSFFQDEDDEFLVNQFASNILMPAPSIKGFFAVRGWNIKSPSPEQIYSAACQFAVGYATLLHHMKHSMGIINDTIFNRLIKIAPYSIREKLLAKTISRQDHLVVADGKWINRPIDLQVGSYAILPSGTDAEGKNIERIGEAQDQIIFRAISPGIAKVSNNYWACFVRVSRRQFEGRSIYRHLEEDIDCDN